MSIVSFINMKGGVGKTTLCVNIAYALSKLGSKVLLIDLDPQFNTTQHFLNDIEYKEIKMKKSPTIFNIFINGGNITPVSVFSEDKDEIDFEDCIYEHTENLHLIPGDLDLIRLEFMDRGAELILRNFLDEHKLSDMYDYILIDCPPTNSLWTTSALLASEYYLIPVKPDFLSTLGLNLFITMVKKVSKKFGHKLKSAGVIFTMVRRTNHADKTMNEIAENAGVGSDVYENNIRLSTKIAKAPAKREFIFDLPDHGKDIRAISREFVRRTQ